MVEVGFGGGWSAQMYAIFIGVNHSWPGWMEDAKARAHKSNYIGFSGYLIGLKKKKKNRGKPTSLQTV
jgi:hypothetical protein